jgi:hypothetical protein
MDDFEIFLTFILLGGTLLFLYSQGHLQGAATAASNVVGAATATSNFVADKKRFAAIGEHISAVMCFDTSTADKFHSLSEVQEALRAAGLESSSLIIGVDYTGSNEWAGKLSFGGKCLHHIETNLDPVDPKSLSGLNPYQQVISIMGRTLEDFDDDRLIIFALISPSYSSFCF